MGDLLRIACCSNQSMWNYQAKQYHKMRNYHLSTGFCNYEIWQLHLFVWICLKQQNAVRSFLFYEIVCFFIQFLWGNINNGHSVHTKWHIFWVHCGVSKELGNCFINSNYEGKVGKTMVSLVFTLLWILKSYFYHIFSVNFSLFLSQAY